jgi:hypothetical protein
MNAVGARIFATSRRDPRTAPAPGRKPRRALTAYGGEKMVKQLIGASAALFALGAIGMAAAAKDPHPHAPAAQGGTLGFVVSRFSPAIYKGENSCPDGLALTPQESFLKQQTPAERARLQRPENAAEFEQKYKWDFGTGPNGEEMCREPRGFRNKYEHPVQRMIQGKVSYGMDLDGDDGSGAPPTGVCRHENFVSPEGERGIDNQLFRAEGCLGYYRGSATDPNVEGAIIAYYNRMLNEGLHTIVIEIAGVDDLRNDEDVSVGFFSTRDKPLLVGKKLMPHSSFTTLDNPRWRHVTKGRIVDGVITTEPFDLVLNMEWAVGGERGAREEYDMRRARFRLQLLPDGGIKGLMGAYQDIDNVYSLFRTVGAGVSAVAGVDCAAEYKALEAMADAYPDASGQCRAVSLAYEVEGVPAFVLHPPGKNDGAAAKHAARTAGASRGN